MAEKKYDSVGEASIRLRFYMDGPQFTPEFWKTLREECAEALETLTTTARETSGGMKLDEYGTKQTILFVPNGPDADGLNEDYYEDWDIAADLELRTRFYVDCCSCLLTFRLEIEKTLNALSSALTEVLVKLGAAVNDASPGPRFTLTYGYPAVYC